MRRAPSLIGLVILPLLPTPASGQRTEPEPYQMFSFALGWGAINPSGETGLEGDVADGKAGIQIGLDIEIRQAPIAYVYGRVDADAAAVRQHLALSGGLRLRPIQAARWRPFAGVGVGLLWLEPKIDVALTVDRQFTPRAEGHVGAEWLAIPGLRIFGEYRLTAARYVALTHRPDCSEGVDGCLDRSSERLTHLGHTGWLGLRIKMF